MLLLIRTRAPTEPHIECATLITSHMCLRLCVCQSAQNGSSLLLTRSMLRYMLFHAFTYTTHAYVLLSPRIFILFYFFLVEFSITLPFSQFLQLESLSLGGILLPAPHLTLLPSCSY